MKKVLLGAASAALLLAAASAANAAINVSLWVDQSALAHDATIAGIEALGAADATLTLPSLDFSTGNSDATTIDQFLGSAIGGSVGGHALDNTVFLFTGSVFLNPGDNFFVVPHDDGLQLDVSGFGRVIDAPGPSSPSNAEFHVDGGATGGSHTFTMSYGECCGGPAEIAFNLNNAPVTGTPEPGVWSLLIMGFGGAGAMLRRAKKLATA